LDLAALFLEIRSHKVGILYENSQKLLLVNFNSCFLPTLKLENLKNKELGPLFYLNLKEKVKCMRINLNIGLGTLIFGDKVKIGDFR
jgi:hypothetical protein